MPGMDNTVTVDLSKGIRFASVDIGEADSYANRFGAKVVASGQQVDLTGASAQGLFIREDGETIEIQGGVENGVAFVVLTPDCYAVVERYQLTLKMISDNALTTLRIVEGRVLRARSGTSGSGTGGGGTSGNITPAMIGAAPANHTSEDSKYGMATADLFGHVKAAWLDKMLSVGREEKGQDPYLWYDQDGNLIGDVDAVEQYLRGIVPNMWLMSVWNQIFSVSFEDLEYFNLELDEAVHQLRLRVETLEDEIAALKGV